MLDGGERDQNRGDRSRQTQVPRYEVPDARVSGDRESDDERGQQG